ncbi:MAG: DNA cytosine methyltransferase [Alphaproteobacteria bacterium]|nr:DNA cytosine methyltransferase [Alphaproteobacteria bacterium]
MKIVSLFSGAGGLDLGLQWAGHDIVWANDIFDAAIDTYKANIGDHINNQDICKVKLSSIPDCDAVVGGFPCQGFSMANMGRTLGDPRNQLYRQMVRIVREKQPRFFVGENVKGLLSLGKGKALEEIKHNFAQAGYRVHHHVVNAADYGVPQSRMRLLIIGIREDIANVSDILPIQTHADPAIAFKLKLKPWITVGEALAHFPEPTDDGEIPNHQCSQYKLRFNGHLGHRYIDPNRPAPTVTGRGDERGGVVVLHHPNNRRRMTARELAAVQSFPDDFVFSGAKTTAYRQIANAVPPLLGKAIGLMLAKANASVKLKKRKAA